jgi:hypothetical protein
VRTVLSLAVAALGCATAPRPVPAETVEVLRLKRPAVYTYQLFVSPPGAGETRVGQIVGRIYRDLFEGHPAIVSEIETSLQAPEAIYGRKIEAHIKQRRIYEPKDGGRILAVIRTEESEGSVAAIRADFSPTGVKAHREAKSGTIDTTFAPSQETLEAADPERLAIARHGEVKTVEWDEDQGADQVQTSTAREETQDGGGAPRRVFHVRTEGKDVTESSYDENGTLLWSKQRDLVVRGVP